MITKYKQLLVIRKDLNMRKGKLASQAAHASLQSLFSNVVRINRPQTVYSNDPEIKTVVNKYYAIPYLDDVKEWFETGCTKICVSVNDGKELVNIYEQAYNSGLRCVLIKDAGRTEFKEATLTAVGIGPDLSDEIDKITGKLLLL